MQCSPGASSSHAPPSFNDARSCQLQPDIDELELVVRRFGACYEILWRHVLRCALNKWKLQIDVEKMHKTLTRGKEKAARTAQFAREKRCEHTTIRLQWQASLQAIDNEISKHPSHKSHYNLEKEKVEYLYKRRLAQAGEDANKLQQIADREQQFIESIDKYAIGSIVMSYFMTKARRKRIAFAFLMLFNHIPGRKANQPTIPDHIPLFNPERYFLWGDRVKIKSKADRNQPLPQNKKFSLLILKTLIRRHANDRLARAFLQLRMHRQMKELDFPLSPRRRVN